MKLLSRIEILDEATKKVTGAKYTSFEDFIELMPPNEILKVVMHSMNKIELQGMLLEREKHII